MNWYPTDNGFVCSTDNGCYYIIRQSGKFRLDSGNGYGKRQSLAACKAHAQADDDRAQRMEDARRTASVAEPATSFSEPTNSAADLIAPPAPAPALPGGVSASEWATLVDQDDEVERRAVKAARREIARDAHDTPTQTLQSAMAETLKRVQARATVAARPNGVILYRGPSLIDGSPIVVVATGLVNKSSNEKTGDMVQTWILADGSLNPLEAIKSGDDIGICGDCIHRGTTCYVNVAQAPLAVWRGVHRGIYPTFTPSAHLDLFKGRHVRLGAYGDPAAVPINIWSYLVYVSAGHTGYTHQWRTCDSAYRHILMASVETIDQRFDAILRGYRTFRVKLADQPRDQGEFTCPASAEAGHRLSCQECGACHGATASVRGASPVINFHHSTFGNRFRFKQYEQTMQRLLTAEDTSRRTALPLA